MTVLVSQAKAKFEHTDAVLQTISAEASRKFAELEENTTKTESAASVDEAKTSCEVASCQTR